MDRTISIVDPHILTPHVLHKILIDQDIMCVIRNNRQYCHVKNSRTINGQAMAPRIWFDGGMRFLARDRFVRIVRVGCDCGQWQEIEMVYQKVFLFPFFFSLLVYKDKGEVCCLNGQAQRLFGYGSTAPAYSHWDECLLDLKTPRAVRTNKAIPPATWLCQILDDAWWSIGEMLCPVLRITADDYGRPIRGTPRH